MCVEADQLSCAANDTVTAHNDEDTKPVGDEPLQQDVKQDNRCISKSLRVKQSLKVKGADHKVCR